MSNLVAPLVDLSSANVPLNVDAVSVAVDVSGDSIASAVPSDLVVPPPPLNRTMTVKPPKDLALVLSVCGQALKLYGQTSVSTVNILIVLKHIISAVNIVAKDLVLADKKQLVDECAHWLIDSQKHMSDDDKNALDLLADTVLPQSLDMMQEIQSCFSCFHKAPSAAPSK